jgi:FkbM family methyltransferase
MKIANIHDMYDQHTVLIMKMVLSRDSCCVDVGAHVGSVLEEIINISPGGKHIAFEPIPYLFEELKSNEVFRNVSFYDFALSDEVGDATFFWVKNDPAYSGLKERRYDFPDPEIQKITVRKARLDDLIPSNQRINLIKIDVEGGELPVLQGAKRIITENKPYIIFESGKGASDRYGTNGASLYEFLVEQCCLEINTLDGFLLGRVGLAKKNLIDIFDETERYYFIAHRTLSESERILHFQDYVLDVDSRLFSMNDMAAKVNRLERQQRQLEHLLPDIKIHDWGDKQTVVGKPVNRQSDGSSALWIRLENISVIGEVYVHFGEHRARGKATLLENVITTDIPQAVIRSAGGYPVVIAESSGRRTPVGIFFVK